VLSFRVPPEGPPQLAWSRKKGVDVPTPVADPERVYLVDDQGIATALDLETGAVVWGPERLATGTYSASPVLAAGRVYATAEDGTTTVFRAGPRFEILQQNEIGGYVLASPAIAGDRIYLRTSEALWAIAGDRSEASATGRPAPGGRGAAGRPAAAPSGAGRRVVRSGCAF
jgi:hypothetical protein